MNECDKHPGYRRDRCPICKLVVEGPSCPLICEGEIKSKNYEHCARHAIAYENRKSVCWHHMEARADHLRMLTTPVLRSERERRERMAKRMAEDGVETSKQRFTRRARQRAIMKSAERVGVTNDEGRLNRKWNVRTERNQIRPMKRRGKPIG